MKWKDVQDVTIKSAVSKSDQERIAAMEVDPHNKPYLNTAKKDKKEDEKK